MATKKQINKKAKTQKKKSMSNSSSEAFQQTIVKMFLEMLNTVKLYHWKTSSYAQHIATDTLYADLNVSIDQFVEIMLGKKGNRVNLTGQKTLPLMDYTDVTDFKKKIDEFKEFMTSLNIDDKKNTDLLNVKDEILGLLNKFTYLLTFK
jgi:hypothetical protein